MQMNRSSGILLHITSLPNKFGIGTFGKEAYEFINFLVQSGQSLWQILPLGPIGYGNSPYSCLSAFAGNPLLIDIEVLEKEGYLSNNNLHIDYNFSNKYVEYEKVIELKYSLLEKAFRNFEENVSIDEYQEFETFCKNNSSWLEDFSIFMSLKKNNNNKAWFEWENKYKFYKKENLSEFI